MKTAALLACCLLLFPLAGAVRTSVPKARAQTPALAGELSARDASFRDLLDRGRESFRAGRYPEGRNLFEFLRNSTLAAREFRLAARATGNLGGCQFALHQYQPALASFLEARRLAAHAGDASAIAAFDANIASLYSETGELEAAAQLMQGSLARMSGDDRKAHLPQLLIQMATIRARQDRIPEARELFRRGIDAADRAGDLELYALGWNRLGEDLLKRGDLGPAEQALLEAFHVHHLALDSSSRNLGRLRLAQGDLASASAPLDRAVELAARPRGLMPLDDALFDIPFAALVIDRKSRPVYLVERHATEVVPGAAYWVESAARRDDAALRPLFLGFGDPIYNTADPRLPRRPRRVGTGWAALRLFAFAASAATLPLPRLVGSSAELAACARAWNGEHILLEGVEASRRNVVEQLRRQPAVAHFATHALESPGGRSSALIALSLAGGGAPELLAPEEIARWRIRTELVVLSGCHSAAGAVLPGTGPIGVTRAWPAPGARTVIGSRWDTPDDDGALFGVLYRSLRARPGAGPGDSLRIAQLEMIRSGGWRARPRYWGAHFVTGTE